MILVYLLIAVMPLPRHPLWASIMGEFTVVKYLGGACLAYSIAHLTINATLPSMFRTWQGRLFGLLFLLAVFSYLTQSLYSVGEFNPILSYASFLLLLFITVSVVDSPERLRRVLLAVVGSVAFASVYVLREWQLYHSRLSNLRPGWVTGDPNYFTVSALAALPIALYLMLERRAFWERWLCFLCLLITLVAVMLAASRGGFIGLVASFLFVVWHSRRRVRNLLLVSSLLVPFIVAVPSSALYRLLKPKYGDTAAVDNRIAVWRGGLRMIEEHPLWGIGLGNFKVSAPSYQEPGVAVRSVAHNAYVEIAAEMGVPALGAFLLLLFCSYRTLEKARRDRRWLHARQLRHAALSLQGALVGCSVAIFFVSGHYQKLYWLVIFLSICIGQLMERSTSGRSRDSGWALGGEDLS